MTHFVKRITITQSTLWFILQADIDTAVKTLLAVKDEYKTLTGKDYKPGAPPASTTKAEAPSTSTSDNAADLYAKVTAQGDKVRSLKSSKESKVSLNHRYKVNISYSTILF